MMTFRLKNNRDMYQQAMNLIFNDLPSIILEVCINDLVIRLACFDYHLANLRLPLKR
jgi:hypothetical protein